MDVEILKDKYRKILSKVNYENFGFENDKYSGVFLPFQFDAYEQANLKVMIIGRETAGWNTDNNKNTLKRIIEQNESGSIENIIDEAFFRYSWHLKTSPSGKLKKKHSSKFQHYFNKVAKELKVAPDSMIYANLFAWDYNKKSPLERPDAELTKITDLSLELVAAQIDFFNPEYIVFATGYRKIDPLIKRLFNVYFDGYKTIKVNPKKLWEFKSANKICFRIAHPRAQHGHEAFRNEVIDKIKNNSNRYFDALQAL